MAANERIVKQRLRALLRTVDFETETQVGDELSRAGANGRVCRCRPCCRCPLRKPCQLPHNLPGFQPVAAAHHHRQAGGGAGHGTFGTQAAHQGAHAASACGSRMWLAQRSAAAWLACCCAAWPPKWGCSCACTPAALLSMCTACVWTQASTCPALAAVTRTLQEEIDQFLSEQQDEEDDADDDFEPEPAPKKARQERGPAPTAPAGDCVVPLSAKRFASVRSFGGRLMADVREFYEKEGQLQVGLLLLILSLYSGCCRPSKCCWLRLLLCLL